MKQLEEFELDGDSIFIEVEDLAPKKGGRVYRERKQGEDEDGKSRRFVDAVERVKPAAEAVLRTFQTMQTPDEIGLEFGVKFNAKAGAILASIDSEATFKVSLKWTRKDKRSQ